MFKCLAILAGKTHLFYVDAMCADIESMYKNGGFSHWDIKDVKFYTLFWFASVFKCFNQL